MTDVFIAAVLVLVFWSYGSDVGTGKWFSAMLYLLMYLSVGFVGLDYGTALIAAVLSISVLIIKSMLQDKKRVQALKDSIDAENLLRACQSEKIK